MGLLKERNMMARKIRSIRKSNKMTQKEFAELIGVSAATVSNYENRKCIPDVAVLKKMREKLGFDLDCGY